MLDYLNPSTVYLIHPTNLFHLYQEPPCWLGLITLLVENHEYPRGPSSLETFLDLDGAHLEVCRQGGSWQRSPVKEIDLGQSKQRPHKTTK